MKERHKYLVVTNDELVLKNIQINNGALSIHEVGDYCGEEGRWIRVYGRFGAKEWECSHCHSRFKTPGRYCNVCGARNEEDWEKYKILCDR